MKKVILSLVLLATLVSCNDKEVSADKVEVKKVEIKQKNWPTVKDKKFYNETGSGVITEVKFVSEPNFTNIYTENACRSVIGAAKYGCYSKPNFIPVQVVLFDDKAALKYIDKNEYGVDVEKDKYVSLDKDGKLKDIIN